MEPSKEVLKDLSGMLSHISEVEADGFYVKCRVCKTGHIADWDGSVVNCDCGNRFKVYAHD